MRLKSVFFPQDITNLKDKLPNLEAVHKVPNPEFSHLDFLWATDARSLVYEKIFDILEGVLQKYFWIFEVNILIGTALKYEIFELHAFFP